MTKAVAGASAAIIRDIVDTKLPGLKASVAKILSRRKKS